jgi:hypothetical protein
MIDAPALEPNDCSGSFSAAAESLVEKYVIGESGCVLKTRWRST